MNFNPIKTALPKSLANIGTVNNQLARNKEELAPVGHRQQKSRDEVKINPTTRVNNIVEAFNQQKKNISEQRSKLVASTLEGGGSIQDIETQLEGYDEALNSIDQQMAEALAKQAEQALEDTKAEKQAQKEDPKTKEEVNAEKINDVISINADIKQSEVVASVKNKVDGEIRVLQQEIEMDGGTPSESKLARLGELEERSMKLSDSNGEMLGEISDKLDSSATTEVADENVMETDKTENDSEISQENNIAENSKDKENKE